MEIFHIPYFLLLFPYVLYAQNRNDRGRMYSILKKKIKFFYFLWNLNIFFECSWCDENDSKKK